MMAASRARRVVVLGGACVDVVLRLGSLPEWQADRQAVLELVVPGGKALNQAVACGRLGADVSLVASVGDDQPGAEVVSVLAEAGVEHRLVLRRPSVTTPMTFVLLDGHGRKAFLSTPLAPHGQVTPEEADAAAAQLRPGDVALATLEAPSDVVSVFLDAARRAGARTILNPAPRVSGASMASSKLLEAAEFVVPNFHEAQALHGDDAVRDPAELASRLAARRSVTVCVTAGSAGCFVCAGDRVRHVPAARASVVDPTGASDAFCAAFAVAVARGADPLAAARIANAAGSAAVEGMGAATSMPDLESVARRCDAAARRALYPPEPSSSSPETERIAVTHRW